VCARNIKYMTESIVTSQDSMGGSINNKEVLYLTFVLDTLKEARGCFKEKDVTQFNLYMSFIEAAVLDDDKSKEIIEKRKSEEKRLQALNIYKKDIIDFMLGFIIVKEVMKYLNNVMELEHTDIAGEVGGRNVNLDEVLDEEQ
jgi:hypothetical protein